MMMKEYNIIFLVCIHPYDLIVAMNNGSDYDTFEPEYGMDEAENVRKNKLLVEIPKSEIPEVIIQDFDFKRKNILERVEAVYVFKTEL